MLHFSRLTVKISGDASRRAVKLAESIKINLGTNVKRLRKERGWSQTELAEKVGVHLNHINRIETGKYMPVLDTVVKLADLFEVSIDYLVNDASGKTEVIRLEDQGFAEKMRLLNSLDEEDRMMIVRSIENALAKQKMIELVKGLKDVRPA